MTGQVGYLVPKAIDRTLGISGKFPHKTIRFSEEFGKAVLDWRRISA